VINREEPAILVCHWPGIYYNGEKTGFHIFKKVVERLHRKYDNLIWMKNSEIARYWAAKKLTSVESDKNKIIISAPFASEKFTLFINRRLNQLLLNNNGIKQPFERINNPRLLKPNTFCPYQSGSLLSFNLQKGVTDLIIEP
jgi:hypothetical protein